MNHLSQNMLHVLLIAFVLTGVVNLADVCESEINVHGKNETNCRQQSLTAVPVSSIPKGTEILLLNFNNLKSISISSFSGLPGLVKLDLSNNDLTNLDTSYPLPLEELNLSNNSLTKFPSLNNFKSLTKIYLAHNSISEIPDEAFRGLGQLKEIDLQRNQIAFLSDQVFEDLHKLDTLDLSYNQLRNLPRHLVSSLNKLVNFYLSGNRLTELPDQFFDGLDSLAYIYLYENPWNCNCALEYLKTWVTDNDYNIYIKNGTLTVNAPESVTCASPWKLRGTPVSLFSIDHCKKAVDGTVEQFEEPTTELLTTPEGRIQPTTELPTTTLRITQLTTILTEPTTTFRTTSVTLTDRTTTFITTTEPLKVPTTTEKMTEPTTTPPITTKRLTEPTTVIATKSQRTIPTNTWSTATQSAQPTTSLQTTTEEKVPSVSHYLTTENPVPTSLPLRISTLQYTSLTQTASTNGRTTGKEVTTSNLNTTEPAAVTAGFQSSTEILSVIGRQDKQFGTLSDYIAKYCCFLHLILYLISLLILLLETLALVVWMCYVYFQIYRPTKCYLQKPPNIWLVRYSLLSKEGTPPRAQPRASDIKRHTFTSFKETSVPARDVKRLSGLNLEIELESLAADIREYSLSPQ